MPLKRDEDNFGHEAFRQALNRQEGSFMRAATYIMNKPKKLSTNEHIATQLLKRNASGQFVKGGTRERQS